MSGVKDFVQYYEAHKKSIFTYILYRVSFDRDLAEDLTSEIFLKAFEYFRTYDANRPFKPWIFQVARNHLINYFVSQKPEKKTLPLEETLEVAVESNIEKMADENMLLEQIEMIVKDLPESHQELILLRYQNGLSHREIAELVGKEEGAIRTAISRALDSIRQKYYENPKNRQIFSPDNPE